MISLSILTYSQFSTLKIASFDLNLDLNQHKNSNTPYKTISKKTQNNMFKTQQFPVSTTFYKKASTANNVKKNPIFKFIFRLFLIFSISSPLQWNWNLR